MRKSIYRIAVTPLLLAGAWAGFGAASPAHAAPGDLVMAMGFVSINNSRSSSTPQYNQLDPNTLGPKLGLVPTSFGSPGTELTIGNAVKPILTFSYFLTEHVAITTVGGIPPTLDVIGHGSVTAPGPLSGLVPPVEAGKAANNPVATAKHWFPALLVHYHFGSLGESHPFIGAGLGYSFFSDVKLGASFDKNLRLTGGYIADPLNAIVGKAQVSTEAKASSAFIPLINAGVSHRIADKWSLDAAVSYIPIKTTATIFVRDKAGNVVLTSKSKLDIPSLATSIMLGYHF